MDETWGMLACTMAALCSALLAPVITSESERRRAARVERDDLARIAHGELEHNGAWADGLRWASARGDVSEAVAEAAGLPPPRPHKRTWGLPVALAAGAGSAAQGMQLLGSAAPSKALLATAFVLSCVGCALLACVALLDSWHHEVARGQLLLGFACLLAARVLAHGNAALVGAALVCAVLCATGLQLLRRCRPQAFGSGDVWLLAALVGLLCSGTQAPRSTLVFCACSIMLALLGHDPEFPKQVALAPLVVVSCLLS